MKLLDEHQTVRRFLTYLKLKWEHGYPVSKQEETRTHECYETFCRANNLPSVSRFMFYKILNQMGIVTVRGWDKTLQRTAMVRNLTKEKIEEALGTVVDTSVAKAQIVEIDGERFQVVVKIIKIAPALPATSGEPDTIKLD